MSHFTDELYDYYRDHAEANGLTTTWSDYTVANLDASHRFSGAATMVYKNHWGPRPTTAVISGHAWSDLWRAAEACILSSGDGHHIFIEDFVVDPQDPSILYLSTGS